MFPYLGPEFITALMEITSTRQRKADKSCSSSRRGDKSGPQMPTSEVPLHTGYTRERSSACDNDAAETAQGLNESSNDARECDEVPSPGRPAGT